MEISLYGKVAHMCGKTQLSFHFFVCLDCLATRFFIFCSFRYSILSILSSFKLGHGAL